MRQAGGVCAGWAARVGSGRLVKESGLGWQAAFTGQGGLRVWAGSGHARERLAGRAEVGFGGSWAGLLEVRAC